MCVKPNWIYHPDGVEYGKIEVPCRKCWQCMKLRIDDYVGRALGEAAVSDWVVAISLTYRDSDVREDDLAHVEVYPRHFQNFIKQLRNFSHVIRYLGTGEKGGLNGRAHFHALLFGRGRRPDWPDDRKFRWHMHEWPHGFVSTEFVSDAATVRYVVKYINKPDAWYTVSKKPPLGYGFFLWMARRDQEAGVLPHRWAYRPPGGEVGHDYLLTGASRREYLLEWARLAGCDVTSLGDRASEWVRRSCEKVERHLAEKREARLTPDELFAILSEEVERARPRIVRPIITDYAFDVDEELNRRLAAHLGGAHNGETSTQ